MGKTTLEDFAIQQLTGFNHAYQGFPISDLLSSMALDESEWERIKGDCEWLDKRLVAEIEEYFRESTKEPSNE